MVREFSKAVKARSSSSSSSSSRAETGSPPYTLRSTRSGGLATPTASPRRTPTVDDDVLQLPKSIYLNLDFPVPTREWEGVFDVWIQGDAQVFAEALQGEIDKEARAKEVASERRRRKEGEAVGQDELPDLGRVRGG
jgi:NAD-dependent histone deacetylase SIR2